LPKFWWGFLLEGDNSPTNIIDVGGLKKIFEIGGCNQKEFHMGKNFCFGVYGKIYNFGAVGWV
jgi:hypothetical protein